MTRGSTHLQQHTVRIEPPVAQPSEDPVLRSARREALVVFATWITALVYTVTYCYCYGYDRRFEDIKFVRLFFGVSFPDWVFWGIVAPWLACFVISWWFSYVFVQDADLGKELEGEDGEGGEDA